MGFIIVLIIAAIGGVVYFLYSQGVFSGQQTISGILKGEKPPVDLDDTIGGEKKRETFKVDESVKVLLVEDRPVDRESIRAMVTETGAQCDVAEGGIKSLDMVKTGNYDLVLMAASMARMDGVQTMRNMKKLEGDPLSQTKVYIIVERDSVEPEMFYEKEGFAGVLKKPMGEFVLWRAMSKSIPEEKILSDKDYVRNMKKIAAQEMSLQVYGIVLSEAIKNFKDDMDELKKFAEKYVDGYNDTNDELQGHMYDGNSAKYLEMIRAQRDASRKLGAFYLSEIMDDHVNMAKNDDMETAEVAFRTMELEWENVVVGLGKWLGKDDVIASSTMVLSSDMAEED